MTNTAIDRESVERIARDCKDAHECNDFPTGQDILEGAFSTLLALRAALDAAVAENKRLREALTPSGDTKAAYMAKIECDCPTETWRHFVPWTSIKQIMAMIRARAALQENPDG